jgi:hypothetical protein
MKGTIEGTKIKWGRRAQNKAACQPRLRPVKGTIEGTKTNETKATQQSSMPAKIETSERHN